MNEYSRGRQIFLIAGAFMGWLGLVLQFYLILANRTTAVSETIIRYFSFFTIQANILLTVCFTFLLLRPYSTWGKFFSKTSTLTVIAIYMLMVGVTYNLVLRMLWKPQGLQRLADDLLHVIDPLWILLFWIFFVSKAGLAWRRVLDWLWYPIIYLVFVLIRGALSGSYPYPFVDVGKLGYPKVLMNSAKLIIVFLLVSLIFVAVGKRLDRARG